MTQAGVADRLRRDGWTLAPQDAAEPPRLPITIRHPEPGLVWRKHFDPDLPCAWHRLDLAYGAAGMVDARVAFVFADGTRLPQHLAKVGRNRFIGLFRPARPVRALEVAVSGSAPLDVPEVLTFRPVSAWERRRALVRRCLDVLPGDPRALPRRAARFVIQMRRRGRTTLPTTTRSGSPAEAYALWRFRFDEDAGDEAFHRGRAGRLARRPLFTIIAAPEAIPAEVAALTASLEAQVYERWDLVRPEPPRAGLTAAGHDAAGLDALLDRAKGDYLLLPHPETTLRPHALLVLAATLERFPAAKLVYADDDDLGPDGRRDPRFKPAWSPARALGRDYVGDLCCVEIATFRTVFQAGQGGSAAWRHDLLLRLAERLAPDDVVHVAQVLSHSTVPSRSVAAPSRRLGARLPARPPLVSLIIPTRDRADLLRIAVGSIKARTRYAPYEIIVVDNGSREPETRALFASWAGEGAIRVLRDEHPFNYAALNNRAAAMARGAVLGLVNNDIEALDGGWLDEMVSLALQPGIGCVGAKLHYPDGRLQHGGVVTGIAGAAGHRHKRAARAEPGWLDSLVTVNEVSAVTAACLVVRKDVYDAVGGLDASAFAVAYNDVDFCLRVAAAGYRNLWTPFAELAHHESVSRGRDLGARSAERFDRETLALALRWGDRLLDDPYYSPNLTVDAESGTIRTQ